MKTTTYRFLLVMMTFALLLTACGPSEGELMATSAAQTVQALTIKETAFAEAAIQFTQTALAAPPPATETPTMLPTIPTNLTPTVPGTTDGLPTASGFATSTNSLPGTGGGQDNAAFVLETIGDGTSFQPGEAFTKKWRLRNAGSSTWTTNYALVHVNGDLMEGKSPTYIPYNIAPGQEVELEVEMKAPSALGTYKGYWKLQNANGQQFGLNGSAIWVSIVVTTAPTAAPTATAPTNTPDPGATGNVTAIAVGDMQITEPSYLQCGGGFTMAVNGTITTDAAATVKYQWVSDGSTHTEESVVFSEAATKTVTKYIQYDTSSQGMTVDMTLQSTSPNVTSMQKTFTISCNP